MWRREIAKIAALLGLLFVLNAVLTDWYRHTVMKDGIADRTDRDFRENFVGVDTLVLGDSHSKWGAHSATIGNAFNLALPGQNYAESYYLLKSYMEGGLIDVRYVVLQADLHSLSSTQLEHWSFLHYYASHVNYLEIGWQRGKPFEYALRQLQGQAAPYVGRRKLLLTYLEYHVPPEVRWMADFSMERGAVSDPLSLTAVPELVQRRRAKARAAAHFRDEDLRSPLLLQYFRRLLDFCADRDIGVVLVKYPVTPDYLDAASRFIDLELSDQRLKELIARYPKVRLLDVRSLFAGRLDRFSDSDHLNRDGALPLSKRIHRELLKLRGGPVRIIRSRRGN